MKRVTAIVQAWRSAFFIAASVQNWAAALIRRHGCDSWIRNGELALVPRFSGELRADDGPKEVKRQRRFSIDIHGDCHKEHLWLSTRLATDLVDRSDPITPGNLGASAGVAHLGPCAAWVDRFSPHMVHAAWRAR